MFRALRPRQAVFDVVLAGLYFLGVLNLAQSDGWWGIIAVLAFTVAMGLRRKSPALALALAWLGALAQMVGGLHPTGIDLAVFFVLYTTAAYGDRIVLWLGLASALGGAVVATGYLYLHNFAGPFSWSSLPNAALMWIATSFALMLAWTVGALVRTAVRARETRIAQVKAESDAAAEQERVRIARDMHDVVAHSLAVVIAQADGARYAAASDPDAATAALTTISSTARSALADVRLLLGQLRHAQSDGPQPQLADLDELYAQVRAAGLKLRVTVDPAPRTEPGAAVQLAVYRILQEAFTNAIRHGDGGTAEVTLAWMPREVLLTVRNRAAADSSAQTGGHGLIGMRERAQLVGGSLEAHADGPDFMVRARIPWVPGPAPESDGLTTLFPVDPADPAGPADPASPGEGKRDE